MRMINLCWIILVFIFIVGCAEIDDKDIVDDSDEGYDNLDLDDDFFSESDSVDSSGSDSTSDDSETSGTTDDCEAGWKCISNNKMVYLNDDCSFGEKKDCLTLCENNTCRPAKVCDVGFKCINDEMFGYQKEDCSWIKKKECEAGCEKGDCVEVDPNATVEEDVEETVDEEEESTPVVNFEQLNIGEEITLEDMPVSLYIIESGRVKITIDGKNSNWLAEGESFARSGLTITVEEILFQEYGIKAISYSVG
ncbi:hypothetical protein HON71_02110 [Candidatus Woesearchaeota archaeon]|jgi:hypothetical protein|nr:hypothetical protein [Candidatus Woesearchaeota archaeon]MBT5342547.1 hypothetical protein [Candidatus Woesearchaeota archaeon]